MNKWHTIIIITILFAGCSTSPLTRYLDFPEKKKQITSTIILTDFVLIEAVAGDTNKVDVINSEEYAKICLNLFAGKLNEKDYHVNRTLQSSVGLLMDQTKQNRVVRTSEEKQLVTDSLTISSPPYFVHDIFSKDTILYQLLKIVYSSLIGYEKNAGETNKNIPAATYLGKVFSSSTIAVVIGIGYDVPITYSSGDRQTSHKLILDKVVFEPVTSFSMMFYLIDTDSGEIIWDYKTTTKGGTINKEKLSPMVERITNELP